MPLSKGARSSIVIGMASRQYGNELVNAIENRLLLSGAAMVRLRICMGSRRSADILQACMLGNRSLSQSDLETVKNSFSLSKAALASFVVNIAGGIAAGVPFASGSFFSIPNLSPVNVNMPSGFTINTSYVGPALQPVVALALPAGGAFPSTGPGRYFQISTAGNTNQYYAWYNVSGGSNTNPNISGFIGIQVDILPGDTAAQIASKTNVGLGALVGSATSAVGAVVTVAPAIVTSVAGNPVFSPIANTYGSTQSVTISSATVGASIYYTVDGSSPTIASPLYSGAISVSASQVVKALVAKAGFANSAISASVYVIGGSQVAAPSFSPVAGAYGGSRSVTVSSVTAGATFYYTTNGVDPTVSDTLYSGPILVNASSTLKVLAVKAGLTDSGIGSAAYVINAVGPSVVALGTAGSYRILSEAGISSTAGSSITGDIAVSPIASTAITGFGLVLDAGGTFSTSSLVSGQVFAANYSAPTPANLTTAISNKNTAYTDAAGRTIPDSVDLASGELGGLTLQPGLYKWNTAVTISNNVTLNGGVNDVVIMQISGALTLATGKQVILTGGLQANNVFWQFSGAGTLGVNSVMRGILLGATNIAVQTTATVYGRLYAGTAVTLDDNDVVSG